MKNLSFLITLCWSVASLIGFFIAKWDLGQTVFFINLGFFSLAFNYYVALTLLTFREHFIEAVKKGKEEGMSGVAVIFIQSFSFLLSQLLFILGTGVSLILTGAFVAAYFYIVFGVESLDEFLEQWNSGWTKIVFAGIVVLLVELIIFMRQFYRFDPQRSSSWETLKPFARNSNYKINTYLFGSVIVISIDGGFNTEETFGYLSLGWLFVLNAIWAFIDLFYPPSLPKPMEEIEGNP